MSRIILVLALLLAAIAQGQAEALPTPPPEVGAATARRLAEAGMPVKNPAAVPGLFTPVDLTAQAAPDWIVDYQKLPDGRLCGTGGCPVQVWVKVGAGPYALAFDRRVLSHQVARHGSGRRWLETELHGVHCGGSGSDPCHYNFEWRGDADDPAGHFAAASIWGKPARYEGPLAQAMPVKAPAGVAVADALKRYRAACAAAAGRADLADTLVRLPDLNRDGRPEWLFDPGQALCLRGDEPVAPHCHGDRCRVQLFTDTERPAAWNADAIDYAVDYTAAPGPRLMVRPAGCVADCPERPLVWHDRERRFTPAGRNAP